jgi:hypothetical protein
MTLALFSDPSVDTAAALASYASFDARIASQPDARSYTDISVPAITHMVDSRASSDHNPLKSFSFPRHERCSSVSGSPRASRLAEHSPTRNDAPRTCSNARPCVRWKEDDELVEVRIYNPAPDAEEDTSLADMFPNATPEELALLWLPDVSGGLHFHA